MINNYVKAYNLKNIGPLPNWRDRYIPIAKAAATRM